MDETMLCNLNGGSRAVTLRLRLLHMWLAQPPAGNVIYNHCCLWVDRTGMLIQMLADPALAGAIEQQLRVGTIYIIKGFRLNIAGHLYRACSFDPVMGITDTTTFQECTLPAADFPADSFEILPYSKLPTRALNHAILSDVVGRLNSIGGIDYQLTANGSTPKQILVLENDRGERVSITLWNQLAGYLQHDALIKADSIEPIIIAVGNLMVGKVIGGQYTCSSSSGTRISVNPRIPEAYHLANFFVGPRNPVAELPVKFGKPEDAISYAEARTRTIAELLDLHYSGASLDEKYFCSGIIKSVESRSPWYYTSCNMCKKSCSTWRGTGFWSPDHWEISQSQVTIGYKIQLTLKDSTGEAPFIVFGPCGKDLVSTTAPLLAQRYPHRTGELPPELSALHDQFAKFEVKLPMVGPNGVSSGEFRVFSVVNQRNHTVQTAVAHGVQPPVTMNSGQSSGMSPSSSSKGKEKVSGPMLFENPNPAFHIGQLLQKVSSAPHTVLSMNERTLHPGSLTKTKVLPSEAPAGSSDATLPSKPTDPLSEFAAKKSTVVDPLKLPEQNTVQAVDTLKIQATPSLPVEGNVSKLMVVVDPLKLLEHDTVQTLDTLKIPATPSRPVEGKVSKLMDASGEVSSSPRSLVVQTSETPQSKIAKTTSSTPPFSSPSTALLLSPLAKVKVEKLDDPEAKGAADGL